MSRHYGHLSYQEIATLTGGNSYDAIEKFLKRNSYENTSGFKLMQDHFEKQMSYVEIWTSPDLVDTSESIINLEVYYDEERSKALQS